MATDEANSIYSTFAGLKHSCFPPDTIFKISQVQFLEAMNYFVENNCKKLNEETRTKLAAKSVLAKEEFTINHCKEFGNEHHKYKGTWVISNLLNRRDLVIHW